MKQHMILLLVLAILSLDTLAQEPTKKDSLWKTGIESAINFSQVSLSNWAAGGENSFAANAFLNVYENFKKGKQIWENKLEIAYGMQKQGQLPVRKSNDKLNISSTYGQVAFKNVYYTAALSFKSQFSDGYKYPNDSIIISSFLAQAYILMTVNIDYKPNDFLSLSISPLSGRITIVNNEYLSEQGAYGVKKGKKARYEFGSVINFNFKKEIIKNVELTNSLSLFSNYLDHPQNIDINWEVNINMKINEFLSSNISTNLIYDDDIKITDKFGNTGPRTQFKEILGVGFTYKFTKFH